MLSLKQNEKTTAWVLLGIVILLSLCLRFYDLGGESYWYDEIIMVRVAQADLSSILHGGRPPVYVVLAHFWIELFGTSEEATRSLSALAGVFSIPIIYLIGKQLFSRNVGIISAFFMAISQFQIYYSQDFRYYSLFVLITLLSYYFYVIALRNGNIRNFILYVLFSVLLFYTHTFGIFVIAAQNLYFLLRWRCHRNLAIHWIISQAIILFAIMPKILASFDKVMHGQAGPMRWLPEPSAWSPLITLRNFIGAGLDYPSLKIVIIGVSFFLIATGAYILWAGKERWLANVGSLLSEFKNVTSKGNELLLLVLWIAIPMLLPLVLSKIFGPMYHHRYMISASPAFYIILAFLVAKLGRVVPELISLCSIVIFITPGLFEFYPSPVREQWREAAKYVEDNSTKDDVIIFAEGGEGNNRDSFNWYYKGDLSECGMNKRLRDPAAIEKGFVKCMKDTGRFWLVVREVPYPAHALTGFFLNNTNRNIKLIRERRFTKITVYLFQMM
jgi:mannosyltransferase